MRREPNGFTPTQEMVASLLLDIRVLSSPPDPLTSGGGRGTIPDYSGVRERMLALVRRGCPDQVVSVGEELLRLGTEQAARSEDEGDTAAEISLCMDVVFQALMVSSLSIPEQILWVIDAEEMDEFDLCTGASCFWARDYAHSDWSPAADELLARLSAASAREDSGAGADRTRRVTDQCIKAMEKAGRSAEVVPLCEREAERTGSYLRLVGLLIRTNRLDDAERWIQRGIERAPENGGNDLEALLRLLKEVLGKRGD